MQTIFARRTNFLEHRLEGLLVDDRAIGKLTQSTSDTLTKLLQHHGWAVAENEPRGTLTALTENDDSTSTAQLLRIVHATPYARGSCLDILCKQSGDTSSGFTL